MSGGRGRVDKNPIGLWHPLEQANKDPGGVVVVEYNFWEIRSSKWRGAGEAERRVSGLREAPAHVGDYAGEVEVDCKDTGAGGEEEVGRYAELGGDVQRRGAEHVEHERADRRERAEEVAERRVHEAVAVEHVARRGFLFARAGRRRRQHVEGDGRVGGRGAGDRRGEVGGLGGRLDERDGDGGAVVEERLGQLDHRRQVADAEARVQNHAPLHHLSTYGSVRIQSPLGAGTRAYELDKSRASSGSKMLWRLAIWF